MGGAPERCGSEVDAAEGNGAGTSMLTRMVDVARGESGSWWRGRRPNTTRLEGAFILALLQPAMAQ